ncbi:40S ribosomal protein [Venturia nashicola]|nr:40S ribosomal protein [Venturia nashicola]
MQFLSILGFLAATSMAAQVTIHNKCSTAVWLKPDSAGATGTPIAIPTRAAWITNLKGTGNAFKLASSPESLNKPVQFDYSVSPDGFTYYDITDGVGLPFPLMAHGDGGCPQVQCPAAPDFPFWG